MNLTKKNPFRIKKGLAIMTLTAVFLSQGSVVAYAGQQPDNQSVNQSQPTQTITGTITDDAGEPLIGVSVKVEGDAKRGGISDVNGEYSIQVEKGTTLVFSYLGYQTVTKKVGNETKLDIIMMNDNQMLDEVVVVGFGGQKKANLTGAVSSVKMDEVLGDRPIINVGAALQGAVPGLTVTGNHQVGQSKSFQIRGAYTLSTGSAGNVSPLILIDNVEGNINYLNPDDIESISVLKDASATAIYGARAAAGVIIVTTKAPKNNTKFTFNYNNNISFQKAINLPEQAALDDQFRMYIETGTSDTYWAANQSVSTWRSLLADYKVNPGNYNIVGDGMYKHTDGKIYYLRERDPYAQLVETSFMQNHNASVQGGSDKVRFRMSAGYSFQDGPIVLDKDKYERMNISSFVSADITSWFRQEVDLKYASSVRSNPQNQNQGGLFTTRLLSYTPEGIIPGEIYGLDGDYPTETPLSDITYGGYPTYRTVIPRVFTKSIIKPFTGFEAVFEYTFDKTDTRYDYYSNQYTSTSIQQSTKLAPGNDSFIYEKSHYFTDNSAINVYGTYTHSFGSHEMKLMGGYNQQHNYYEYLDGYVLGQDVKEIPAFTRATGEDYVRESYSEYALRGVFYRANYNYDNRYLFEASGRYDGSSKFQKNNRFGFFPAFSAGWNVSEEAFMHKIDWLNQLKVRASWGYQGNQNISPYSYLPTMGSGIYGAWLDADGNQTKYIDPPALVSGNFTWEEVEKINFGLDFSFLKSRLSGTAEIFQNTTTGMLAPGMELPGVTGTLPPTTNTADMRTRGWEFSIGWHDRIGNVGYHVNANISDYTSEVTKYDENATSKRLSNYYPGYKLGQIWGYIWDGFYTADDFEDIATGKLKEGVTNIQGYNTKLRPGDYKWKNLSDAGDLTPENTITDGANTAEDPGDRKIIGNTLPRYQFGATLGVNYKGFDLSAVLQGVGKKDVWLGSGAYFPFTGGDMFTAVFSNQLDYWQPVDAKSGDYTPVNPNAKLPRIYNQATGSTWGTNARTSDKLLSSAAYMRIKNVTLAYNIPQPILNKVSISGLKVFVSIENLTTFTSLPKGYDPETLGWTFPCYRTTSFGLSLNL